MKRMIVAVLLAGLMAAEVGKYGVEEVDDVAVLTKDNFADFVKKHQNVFVKFYAPWCGHCKTMAPGYSKLAARLKAEDAGIVIAKVDATVESELGEKFGVKGYPTLKFFRAGEPVDYSGAREEEAIYAWLQKKTGPASRELAALADLQALEDKKLAAVLFAPAGSPALAHFDALAAAYDDLPFYFTHSEEARAHYGVPHRVGLVLFRSFDEGRKTLSREAEPSTEEMRAFVEEHRLPFVMEFEQEAAEKIFGSEATAIFLFSDEKESPALAAFREAARARPEGLLFSTSTITSGLGARLAEYLGVAAQDKDSARLIKFEGGNLLKYRLAEVSADSLRAFLADFKAGSLKAYFKSEPVPAASEEALKVVVGDSFEELVVKSDKHVLLEAYAPWCGHCKKLEPAYKELAEKFAAFDDVLIAKMDATANEHPSLNVKGFPTIKFYKKGDKANPIDFEGERTLEGFAKFLEKQTGHSVTLDAADTNEKVTEEL